VPQRQGVGERGEPMGAALQVKKIQVRLDQGRAEGAVSPYPVVAGVGEREQIVELLTCVHGRIGSIPFADKIVRLLHAAVMFVGVEALVVLPRPARVLVLLGILGGLLLPSLGRLAGLDRLVLLLGVTLLGRRYNCGVNDLFFFQEEDGIRDWSVTGVQTCALPISTTARSTEPTRRRSCEASRTSWSGATSPPSSRSRPASQRTRSVMTQADLKQRKVGWIGRASCRERGESWEGAVAGKKRGEGQEA